jgi:hypothetical protein
MATPKSRHKVSTRSKRRASAAPKDYWRHRARPGRFGDERFRVSVLQPVGPKRKSRVIRVTDQVTDFSWEDTSSELTGTMTFQAMPVHVTIGQTNKIRVDWAPRLGAKMDRLWTMQVASPDRNMVSAQWSLDLSTSMTQARKSRDDYHFKRDKSHPRGWTADQVARHFGARVGLPLGRLAKCTHRITNLVKRNADPVDVIVLAYRAERRATGRRFFLTWDGALNIDPLKRSEYLLDLSGAIIDASYKAEYRDSFATAVTVRGTERARDDKHKDGTKRKSRRRRRKFHVTVRSPAGVRQYGYVHRSVEDPDAHTVAEAKRYGRQVLAKAVKPQRTLTVQVPLMPTVRRGDAFKVVWKAEGLTQIVFVSAASHSVSASDMTTQLTATFDDPYRDQQADIDAARRRAAARKRRRKAAAEDKAPSGPTGRRGSRRRSAH